MDAQSLTRTVKPRPVCAYKRVACLTPARLHVVRRTLHVTCATVQSPTPSTPPPLKERGSHDIELSFPVVIEPLATSSASVHLPGTVFSLHSQDEFESMLTESQSHNRVTILMCKAKGCRPCKAFQKKYSRLAEAYPDAAFLEIFGDETKETRSWMISMDVRATPTFRLYNGRELVDIVVGTSETKLENTVRRCMGLPLETDTAQCLVQPLSAEDGNN